MHIQTAGRVPASREPIRWGSLCDRVLRPVAPVASGPGQGQGRDPLSFPSEQGIEDVLSDLIEAPNQRPRGRMP